MKRTHHRAGLLPGILTLATVLVTPPPALEAQSGLRCASCHGELEFLRQHTPTLEDAQDLHVPPAMVSTSAHAGMECSDCHGGYRRYPHTSGGTTDGCASCHEEQNDAWSEGIHASEGIAECTSCHGIHDVRTVRQMHEPDGVAAIQAACAACHFEPRTPEDDPHALSESCSACHEPHRTLSPANPEASIHPLNQLETCGACHEDVATGWRDDAHGTAVPRLASEEDHSVYLDVDAHLDPPACTGCHGSHGMLTPTAPDFSLQMAERCSRCHEDYSESFADSYHGQATELGSDKVATCYHCHGAHDILPSSETGSRVSEANLLGTCQSCHPDATAGFALFQPHADHSDRENYPYTYWAYHLMTALLIGTFTAFGIHTALWVVRLGIEAVRGDSGHAPTTGA